MATATEKLIEELAKAHQGVGGNAPSSVLAVLGILADETLKENSMCANEVALKTIRRACSPPYVVPPGGEG